MAAPAMSHPSRPGFHDAPLSAACRARLALVAEAMIPPAAGWPPAGELVAHFVSRRTSPAQRDSLEALLEPLEGLAPEAVEGWLGGLESGRPESFAELRTWVYHGYYTSGAVIDVLDAAAGYHGAPQPLGYRIETPPRAPAHARGSYRRTEEVADVLR